MNILRDILPSAYTVLEQLVSDPIEYKRGAAAFLTTTATPMPTVGDEPTQGGNVLKMFMSQAQVGATPPARGDSVVKDGITYVVNKVESNDYGGYFLILLKK
jgi:hypothetical protein